MLSTSVITTMSIFRLFVVSLTSSILCLISVYILLSPSSEKYDKIVYLANKIEFCEPNEYEFPPSRTVFTLFYDEVLYNNLIQQKLIYFESIEKYIMFLTGVSVTSILLCVYLIIYCILKYL